jgi:ubiquinone/menaquinone biosynthesis C-methylase UbiE
MHVTAKLIGKGFILLAGLALIAIIILAADLRKMDFSNPLSREGWQLPDQVIEKLSIQPGQTVADIGSGDGYFTFRLAQEVGPDGIVFAVDVDEEVVEKLRKKAAQSDHRNIRVVLGKLDDPRLTEQQVDLAFLCHSYHHIENRNAYFALLKTYLKPSGRLAVIDLKPIPLVRILLPHDHWIAKETIEKELQQVGYQKLKGFELLPAQNFQLFSAGS